MRTSAAIILGLAQTGGATAQTVELRLAVPSAVLEQPPADALSAAIRAGADPGLVEALIAAGADAGFRDAEGRTPLHHASRSAAPRVIALLLGAGADPCATDARGAPALSAEGVFRARRDGAPGVAALATAAFLGCLE